jgi:predicted  nucleic acid-binding Zn-ribbon protein
VIACKTLIPVQEIDLEIDSVNDQLELKRQQISKSEETLADGTSLVEKKEALKNKIKLRIRKLELELETLNEGKNSNELKLSRAGITPKAYVAIENEIKDATKKIDEIEISVIENLEKVDKLEADITKSRQRLKEQDTQLKAQKDLLEIDTKNAAAKIEELSDSKKIILLEIEASVLEEYEELRRAKKGKVLFEIDDPGCPKCGMGFSSAFLNLIKSHEECEPCPSCGVLLCWVGARE